MRILRRMLLWLFIVWVFAFIGLFVLIAMSGRQIAEQKLSEALRRPVAISDIRFLFPLGARLADVRVGEALEVKDARIQLAFPFYFEKRFVFSKVMLTDAVIFIEKTKEHGYTWGKPLPARSSKTKAGTSLEGIFISYLETQNSRIEITNHADGKNFHLSIHQMELKLRNLPYPLAMEDTRFDLAGMIKEADLPLAGNLLKSEGTINFRRKNMDCTATITSPDHNFIWDARLKSVNNEMAVEGRFRSSGSTADPVNVQPASTAARAMQALQAADVGVDMNFRLRTKMDNVELDKVTFDGNIILGEERESTLGEDLRDLGRKFFESATEGQRENRD